MLVGSYPPINKRILRRTDWDLVWRPDGRSPNRPITRWPLWVRALLGHSGIYFIRCRTCHVVLYIGQGKCLKKALLAHFRNVQRDDHHRAYFDRTTVEAKVYHIANVWRSRTEVELIRLHDPPHNILHREREPGEDGEAITDTHSCNPPKSGDDIPF